MNLNEYFSFDITPYTKHVEYLSSDIINAEGSNMNVLYFVRSGTVKCIETQENGVVNLISYLHGPCFLGDLELVGARKSSSGIIAVSNCSCDIIQLDQCRDLIMNDIKFLQYLCHTFALKTVRNGRNMTIGQSYPLKNRFATFLLNTQINGLYTIPHTEASSYLGVSYRHLLYVLSSFVKEGYLEKTKSGYRIRNQKALEMLYVHQAE